MIDKQVVRRKIDCFELWRAGAFGNRSRLWRTVDEWRGSGFSGLVVLRYLGRTGGKWCKYDVEPGDVDSTIAQWVEEGADVRQVMINEAVPANDVVLQGELWTGGDDFMSFYYSTIADHMRPALANGGCYAKLLQTKMLLQGAMTPSSWNDLQELISRYDDHAIELSIFGKCLGNIPGRNAIVWEVRKF